MDVVVAGGAGKVGLRLLRLLADRGHRARGLIRRENQVYDLHNVGAEAVLCDIEERDDISECCGGADAVVFAAGAGNSLWRSPYARSASPFGVSRYVRHLTPATFSGAARPCTSSFGHRVKNMSLSRSLISCVFETPRIR